MDLGKFLKDNLVNEAISSRDMQRACELIDSYLNKHKVYICKQMQIPFSKGGKSLYGVPAFNNNGWGVMFCWDLGHSNVIDSIMFTKEFDEMLYCATNAESFKWDIVLECKGASIVRCCQMVAQVMSGKIPMTFDSVNKAIDDAKIWEEIQEEPSLKSVLEGIDDPSLLKLKRQKDALYMKIRMWSQKGKDTTELQQEYDDLTLRYKQARTDLKKGITTDFRKDKDIETVQSAFEDEERATPEERFEDMKSYLYNVIEGIKPLVLICGAPGVGKTYRVTQAVRGAGKEPLIDFDLIKGKCTPQAFYMSLHDFKEEGDLVIIDDADEVVKDPVSVNLIKAAADSSDERIVTYGTARPPQMTPELAERCDDAVFMNGRWYYPNSFEFRGGLIIITNMRAGMIDTAIRNRALICDLDFTIEETLGLIEQLAPRLKPGSLSEECKKKAMDYLYKLAKNNVPMEISIRSYVTIVGLYSSGSSDKDVERRIREQMRLQVDRSKTRY